MGTIPRMYGRGKEQQFIKSHLLLLYIFLKDGILLSTDYPGIIAADQVA